MPDKESDLAELEPDESPNAMCGDEHIVAEIEEDDE
jgi:hypothetical protein